MAEPAGDKEADLIDQRGGPLRIAICTPRDPRAITPLSLKSICRTGPSWEVWALKEVYGCNFAP